ncbi:MAG: AraC family transcriptional regulator [Ruminococcaceae bacterium]|nr:AraC family transcriptional regulator [Oscillospiraceae bacterium]
MPARYEMRTNDFYCRDSRFAGKTLGVVLHLHDQIELGLVLEGRTRITVDSQIAEAGANDLFIVFPNQLHRLETLERERYILFIVNPDMIPEFSRTFITTLPAESIVKGAGNDPELVSLMHRISDTYRSDEPFKDAIIRGYLLAFFGKLLCRLDLKDIRSRDIHALGLILNYCSSHYDEDLTLSLLEHELHISKYYISHLFGEKLHMGFNEYINSLRISAACRLLLQGSLSVTEVSQKVGFNTLRTFNRAFLRHVGTTPSQYRGNRT